MNQAVPRPVLQLREMLTHVQEGLAYKSKKAV